MTMPKSRKTKPRPMKKFEYTYFVDRSEDDTDTVVKRFNELGEKGWELITITDGIDVIYTFKREKK